MRIIKCMYFVRDKSINKYLIACCIHTYYVHTVAYYITNHKEKKKTCYLTDVSVCNSGVWLKTRLAITMRQTAREEQNYLQYLICIILYTVSVNINCTYYKKIYVNKLHTYITYVIGHYNPSVRIIVYVAAHATHVAGVNFIREQRNL